jgi:hypothetical protein
VWKLQKKYFIVEKWANFPKTTSQLHKKNRLSGSPILKYRWFFLPRGQHEAADGEDGHDYPLPSDLARAAPVAAAATVPHLDQLRPKHFIL